ncbi:hypothetical protein Ahu01nite_075520 [Winogradskya humida]|uniref:Uncharacterized protein n=1 Tax=Winogradskya humida TaxID=113566 RepID=A0ABQ4A0R2_9ACTN|nr:hypothetical protein Ahu01nite_075520 [Actinoplanes humidus]
MLALTAPGSASSAEYADRGHQDPGEYTFAADVVREALGKERFDPMTAPLAVAEHFSRVLEEVPGCFLTLGATAADDPAKAAPNHSPNAVWSPQHASPRTQRRGRQRTVGKRKTLARRRRLPCRWRERCRRNIQRNLLPNQP